MAVLSVEPCVGTGVDVLDALVSVELALELVTLVVLYASEVAVTVGSEAIVDTKVVDSEREAVSLAEVETWVDDDCDHQLDHQAEAVVEALSVVELNSVEVGRIDDDAEDLDSDRVAETLALAVDDAPSTLEDERDG
jgi:hypothetical protein